MRTLKIVVAEDHQLMLEAIRLCFLHEDDVEIVGEATAGRDVVPVALRAQPDVVLLDVDFPDMDGLRCLEQLRRDVPSATVVMFSGIDDTRVVAAALDLGAACYVLKSIDPRDLGAAIRQSVEGTVLHASAHERDAAAAEADLPQLSERELSILKPLAAGRSNRDIAQQLWLAEQTVKFHLTNIYRKLGVTSRTDAIQFAYRHGLVGPGLDRG
jgi:DNA-binding NarL/FixJ family response regulator